MAVVDELTLKITIDQAQGSKGLNDFKKNFEKFEKRIVSFGKSLEKAFVKKAAQSIIDFTKNSIKQFAKFESVMKTVQRVTGETGEWIKKLGNNLRNMSIEMFNGAISAEELANVAGIAGQAGISASNDISKFTETITKMGIATDLTTQKAAEMMPKIASAFEMPIQHIELLGSVIDVLGNKFNATQREITEATRRMAGTASVFGLTADQTAAVAATMIDAGVKVRVGATAMGQAMRNLLADSNDFAQEFRLDAEDLRRALEENPILALKMVLQGIDDLRKTEGPTAVIKAFRALHMTGQGVTETLFKMAGAQDKFTDAQAYASKEVEIYQEYLRTGNEELLKQLTLNKEVGIALDSLANRMKGLRERIHETYRTVGEQLAPALSEVIDTNLSPLIDQFNTWLKTSVEAKVIFEETIPNAIRLTGQAIKGLASGLMEIHNMIVNLSQKLGWYIGQQTSMLDVAKDTIAAYANLYKGYLEFWKTLGTKGPKQAIQELSANLITLKENLTTTGEAFEEEAAVVKDVTANFEEMNRLLPSAFTPLIEKTTQLYEKNAKLIDSNKKLRQMHEELQQTLLVGETCYRTLQQAQERGIDLTQELTHHYETYGETVDLVKEPLRANADVLDEWKTHLQDAGQQVADLEKAIKQIKPAIKDNTKALEAYAKVLKNLGFLSWYGTKVMRDLRSEFEETGEALLHAAVVIDAVQASREELQKMYEKERELARLAYEAFAKSRTVAVQAMDEYTVAVEELYVVMGGTIVRVGEFGEVSEETAQALDQLRKEAEEMTDITGDLSDQFGELGDALGMSEFDKIGNIFNKMSQWVQLPSIIESINTSLTKFSTILGQVDIAAAATTIGLIALGAAVVQLGKNFLEAQGASEGMIASWEHLGPMGLGIGLVYGEIADAVKGLADAVKGLFDGVSEGTKALKIWQRFVHDSIEGGEELAAMITSVHEKFDFKDQLAGLHDVGLTVHNVLGGISEDWQAGTSSMDRFVQAIAETTGFVEKAGEDAIITLQAMEELGYSITDIAMKMGEMTATALGTNVQLEQMSVIYEMLRNTTDLTKDEFKALQDQLRQLEEQVSGVTEKTEQMTQIEFILENVTGLTAEQIENLNAEMAALEQQVEATTAKMDRIGALQTILADPIGLTAEQVAALEAELAALESEMLAGVEDTEQLGESMSDTSENVTEVTSEIDLLIKKLNKLPSEKTITLKIIQKGTIPEFAHGIQSFRGGLALVGEKGAELAQYPGGRFGWVGTHGPEIQPFPEHTKIIPHHQVGQYQQQVQSFAAGGTVKASAGNVTNNFNVHIHTSKVLSKDVVRDIEIELDRMWRRRSYAQ